jgi:hypothetical protein
MTDYAEHPDLEVVREVVPQLSAVLRQAGFTQELAELGDSGTDFSQVNSALGRWAPPPAANRLLYWAGHGYRDPSGDLLLVRDTPKDRINAATAMSAGALAGVLAGLPVAHTAIVIDTCFAGGSATEAARALLAAYDRQTFPDEPPSLTIVAVVGPYDHIRDGAFSRRFHDVLARGRPLPAWSAGNRRVRLYDVVLSVRDECREYGDPEPDIVSKGWGELTFPNPRAIDLPPDDAETQHDRQARLLARSPGDHFLDSTRGIEVDETGWFFTGRTALLRTINAWLREPAPYGGILIVTGSPGTGKSAVLGRIATLSDPVYRALAGQEGALTDAEPGTVPDEGIIDVAVHAKNKSLRDIQDALAAGLGLPSPPAGWPSSEALIDAVAGLGRRVRIIVDALDEAVRTAIVAIATDLLRPLAARPDVQVIVGTRARLPGGLSGGAADQPGHGTLLRQLDPDRANIHVLDEDPSTPASIARYVRRRLLETPGSPYLLQPLADAELDTLVAAIAGASGMIFLFARLVTRSLLRRAEPLMPGAAIVEDLLAGEAEDVFRADLDRFEGTDRLRVYDMLRALAWADGNGFPRWPVWPEVASRLSPSGARYGVHDVDWVLENAGYHITESREDGQAVYRLYHQAFADFFLRDEQ